MERPISAIRHGDQVIGAEGFTTTVAVELRAAGTEKLAAGVLSAGVNFEECVATIFVVLDRKALENRVASGAGSGSELRFHEHIIA